MSDECEEFSFDKFSLKECKESEQVEKSLPSSSESSDDEWLEDSYALIHIRRVHKKIKVNHVQPIVLGLINIRKGKPKYIRIHILLDSGMTGALILSKYTNKLHNKETETIYWKTQGGNFKTTKTCKIQFQLPELDDSKTIEWKVYVDECTDPSTSNYDMIIGTEILEELKIDLKFSERIITWGNASTPMKDRDTFLNQDLMEFYIYAIESTTIQEATDRMKRILDAKYEKADLDKTVNDITYLNNEEKSQLLNLLKEYEYLFDGMLGIWNIEPLN